MQQPDLLSMFLPPLERAGIDYMVTGSVASTFYGEPRLTHDIDLVVVLTANGIQPFIKLFPPTDYYCPPEEVLRIEVARRQHARFNLIHHDSGYKADCYISGGHPLHAWGMQHRRRLAVAPGLEIWVAPPEYVVVRKLQFYREGKSEKHISDVKKMLVLAQTELSVEILMPLIEEYRLMPEWDIVSGRETDRRTPPTLR